MLCPKCGTNVDDRASFCPICGNQLNTPVPTGSGYRAPVTQRGIALSIILVLVTCGIYALYWLYCLVTDLNTASGETDDTSGGMVLLLSIVTCGIYQLYWYYKAAGKVNRIRTFNGEVQDSSLGILYLLLSLFGFGIVSMALIQNELNKVAGA